MLKKSMKMAHWWIVACTDTNVRSVQSHVCIELPHMARPPLKVHLHEILSFCFFHKKQASGPLITTLVYFRI
jgi:hypothetical protein